MAFKGKILALDIATRTGFAIGDPDDDVPLFGTFTVEGHSDSGRFVSFGTFVDQMIAKCKPAALIYEQPYIPRGPNGNFRTAIFLFRLTGIADEHATRAGMQIVTEDSSSQVRMHFISKNPNRDEAKAMTVARCKTIGWAVTNDDEADACAVWSYARALVRPEMAVKSMPLFVEKPRRRRA